MTRAEVLEKIDRADEILVGVKGLEGTVYLSVSADVARKKADVIAGFGLRCEFSECPALAGILYIEAD